MTPLTEFEVEPNRRHSISLRLKDYAQFDTTVYLEPDMHQNMDISLHLLGSSISVMSDPLDATVMIDGEQAGTTPVRMFEVSPNIDHSLTLHLDGYQQIDTTISALAGVDHRFNIQLDPVKSWLTIRGDEGIRVSLAGEDIGQLPLDRLLLPIGTYELLARRPEFISSSKSVIVDHLNEASVEFSLQAKPKAPAVALSTLFPGGGQVYQGYQVKGLVYMLGAAALAYTTYTLNTDFQSDYDNYRSARADYLAAGSQSELASATEIYESSYDSMKASERSRNGMLLALGLVWTVNLVDVAF